MADQLLSTREDVKKIERELESAHQVAKTRTHMHTLILSLTLQLAEKRKTLLDEMAIRDQETASVAKRREDNMEEKFRVIH